MTKQLSFITGIAALLLFVWTARAGSLTTTPGKLALTDSGSLTDSPVSNPSEKSLNIWASGGFGIVFMGSERNMTAGGSLSYQRGKRMISGRVLSSIGLDLGLGDIRLSDRPAKFFDTGLLYGVVHRDRKRMASIAAGLAVTQVWKVVVREARYWGHAGWYTGTYEESTSRTTIGIPVEAQMSFIVSPYATFGLHCFGNLNAVKAYFGFLFGLQIGKLR